MRRFFGQRGVLVFAVSAVMWGGVQTAGATVLWSEDFSGSVGVDFDPTGWSDPFSTFYMTGGEYLGQADIFDDVSAFPSDSVFPLSDYIYTAQIHGDFGGAGAGISGRFVDENSFWFLSITSNGASLSLSRVLGGPETLYDSQLISGGPVTSSDTLLLRLIFDGTDITGLLTDVSDPNFTSPLAEVSTSSGFNPSSGGVGLTLGAGSTAYYYDNLVVSTIPEPAALLVMGLGAVVVLVGRRRGLR